MANTKKYLSHLLQNTGITPACSEEERAAADAIAKVFADHGFTPEMQEFSASGMAKVVQAGLGLIVFVGTILAGLGGALGMVGLLLSLAAAVLFVMERSGRPVLSSLGAGGLSQNVIAYHKASGPLASPRNRPVVVVAHYDSPREDLLSREPFAAYKPLIVKLLPFAMVAPAVIAVVRLFPVPDPAKVVLWVLAILVSLIPLANGVAILANRFVLPYTTGAVSNKSSVAAMLGVMDAVAPYELGEEFPQDTPADEYFAEQQRILDEAIAAAEAAAAAEAEAAMAYPHELEARDGETAADGAFAVDAPDADALAETSTDLPPFVDDTSTDMPAVDLGSTAMMEVTDAAAPAAESVEDDPVVEGATAVSSAVVPDEPEFFDAGATVANMPVVVDEASADETVSVSVDADEPASAPVEEEIPSGTQGSLDLDAAEPEPKLPFYVNGAGNVRFGSDVIRSLGMLPESCTVVYEATPESEPEPEARTAFEAPVADVQPTEEERYVAVDDEASASAAEAEPASFELEEAATEDAFAEDAEVFTSAAAANAPEDDQADAFAYAVEVDDDFDGVMEAEYEVIEDEEPVQPEETDVQSDDVAPEGGHVEPIQDIDMFDVEDGAATGDDASVMDDVLDDVDGEPNDTELPFAVESPAGSLYDEEAALFGSTEVFAPAFKDDGQGSVDLSGTIAMPAQPVETVDSLMAQIDSAHPARPQRTISVPSTADAPVPHMPQTANRASLFDLPDPSATPLDPFAVAGAQAQPIQDDQETAAREARSAFTVVSSSEAPVAPEPAEEPFETISAPAPMQEKPRRGLARLFGRKKKNDDSMSDWLGVDDSFDAKSSGSDIGSWDNFDDDWKGGAAGYDGATEEELREAVADMGDAELLGHDIWFVATGASENGNAGVRAFLDAHRDKLRGVFLINLESVGAGQLAMLATEGEQRVLKGDKRIMKLVQQVSSDFHRECASVDMPYVTTDAHVAMGMSLRSLTIGGIEGTGFALSHTEEDQPYNVDTDNVAFVSDVVTEVIRRS